MTVQLGPGGNTALDSSLENIQVALTWKRAGEPTETFDIDACAFLVDSTGKVRTDKDFVFYNQSGSSCGAVRLRSGTVSPQIFDIDLEKIPEEVAKIEFALAIHPQPGRVLDFSQLQAAGIEVGDSNSVLISYSLDPRAHSENALLFGELYRHRGSWKFRALGQGFMGGLAAMATVYGVTIAAEMASPHPEKQPEITLVPKTPAPPPPPLSVQPQAPPGDHTKRASTVAEGSDSTPKRKRSIRVPLVLAGAAAVFILTRCDSDDRVRYVYANQADCIEDWDADDCYYDDGGYSAYVSTSHPKFKAKSKGGSKALKVVRSGFGRFASSFGGSRS